MTTLILPADGDTGWGTKARTAWTTTINVADAAQVTASAASAAAAAAQSTANSAYSPGGATKVARADLDTSTTTSLGKADSALQVAPVGSVAGRTGAIVLAESDITSLVSDLALKATLATPVFTGTPAAPTATAGTNTTQLATTAFVTAAVAVEASRASTAEALKAPLISPALTGTPTAPTATVGTNTTQIATTAFVLANAGSGGAVTSVAGRTGAVVLAESDITSLPADLAAKAPTASPTFTGTFTVPAGVIARAALDSSTATSLGKADSALQSNAVNSVAGRTGAVVLAESDITSLVSDLATLTSGMNGKAPLASPALIGAPTAPTATPLTNTTQLATTAYADAAVAVEASRASTAEALKAPLASPTLTGTPAAPTATAGTNTTQLATTAFATAADALILAAATLIAVNTQAGAYTLVLTDAQPASKAVEDTSATAVAITVPPNSSVAFPIGSVVEVVQMGAGQLTVTAGAGVTIHSAGNLIKTRVQYSVVSLRKQATDTWLLAGDVA